jgi:SAM-dependent methyltransferase
MTSSATPDFGRRVAARYDELRPFDAGFERLLGELDRAAGPRGCSVLDVGCGTGTLAVALARDYGCTVCGIDASPEMIAVAEAKRVPGARFVVASAEALPFADGSFERAGFESVRVERTSFERAFDRETALGKLRGRHVSSFDLLEEAEVEEGVARAEAELPGEVRYALRSLLVVAHA